MGCECYVIGGPWIGADPDCAAHGDEAVARAKEQENVIESLRNEIAELRTRVSAVEDYIIEENAGG